MKKPHNDPLFTLGGTFDSEQARRKPKIHDLEDREKAKICKLVDKLQSSKAKRHKVEEQAKCEKEMLLQRIYSLEAQNQESHQERRKMRKELKKSQKALQDYQLRFVEDNKFESTNPSVSTYWKQSPNLLNQTQPLFQTAPLTLTQQSVRTISQFEETAPQRGIKEMSTVQSVKSRPPCSPLRRKMNSEAATTVQSFPATISDNLYHRFRGPKQLQPQHHQSSVGSSSLCTSYRTSSSRSKSRQKSHTTTNSQPTPYSYLNQHPQLYCTEPVFIEESARPKPPAAPERVLIPKPIIHPGVSVQSTRASSTALKQYAAVSQCSCDPRLNAVNVEHLIDPESKGENPQLYEISHLKQEVLQMTSSIKKLISKVQESYEPKQQKILAEMPKREPRELGTKTDGHVAVEQSARSSVKSRRMHNRSCGGSTGPPSVYEQATQTRPPRYLVGKGKKAESVLKSPEAKDLFSRYRNAARKPICPRKASLADMVELERTLQKDLGKAKRLVRASIGEENIERSFQRCFNSGNRVQLRREFDDELLLQDIANFQ